MTALWRNDGSGWGLLVPRGFLDEAALHELVEEAPQLLPLSGSPQMVVVGREVPLGGGYADLVAVERSGRMAVIEVKLARNSEARRAVVAQVLTYAAFLHGMDVLTLEREVLHPELRKRGFESLANALAAGDQEGSFNPQEFSEALAENLASGAFRLVLVLDDAPAELVRLVGYLEAVGGNLVINLVTVTAYDVDGTKVMVPQRVEPERVAVEQRYTAETSQPTGYLVAGAADFQTSITTAAEKHQPELRRLLDWAISLEHEGLARLFTYHGKGRKTLLPRLYGDDVGLATIWNDNGAYISVWRSVFERRAPGSITTVETALGVRIGTGNTVRLPSDEALGALTEAYRQAARAIE